MNGQTAHGWAVRGLRCSRPRRAGAQRGRRLGSGQGARRPRPALRSTPERFKAFTLDQSALQADLAGAPKGARAARRHGSCSRCRRPTASSSASRSTRPRSWRPGSPPSTRRSRPTRGSGIDDPTASIVADTSPLGFHASVRARQRRASTSTRTTRATTASTLSYFTRDAVDDEARSVRRVRPGRTRARPRTQAAGAALGPEVQLRTYRLALITDPTLRDLLRRPPTSPRPRSR